MTQTALEALRESQRNADGESDGRSGDTADSSGVADPHEWAGELAALGERRNLLERTLRSVFLNFIRFACLSDTTQGVSVRERIQRGVSDRRRRELRHLSAEGVLSKFTWKELTDSIKREWVLFEKVFGDRKRFGEASEVINERFDAHAKDADLADFALYRRELTYLEEKLGKLE